MHCVNALVNRNQDPNEYVILVFEFPEGHAEWRGLKKSTQEHWQKNEVRIPEENNEDRNVLVIPIPKERLSYVLDISGYGPKVDERIGQKYDDMIYVTVIAYQCFSATLVPFRLIDPYDPSSKVNLVNLTDPEIGQA